MAIVPTGRAGPAGVRAGFAGKASTGFVVPGQTQAQAPAPLLAAGLAGYLSLQEVEPGLEQDRRARRHGQNLLGLLGRLQQTLLGCADGDGTALLNQLADLARTGPLAADPALRAVIDAISLRAHVELARHAVARRVAGDQGAAHHISPWRHADGWL